MCQPNYVLKSKSLQLLGYYDRWRKRAAITGLSLKARLRLEWIIFYFTASKKDVTCTAKHFGISRSKFYFWFSRFDDKNLKTLEDKPSRPFKTRSWNPDPLVLERMITLRKKYIHWSKLKLCVHYFSLYGQKISSWQFQRVIQSFKLYPARKVRKYAGNGAKKLLVSQEIREKSANLYSVDTKELWLFQKKYYILVAIGHTGKLTYARAYPSHSSKVAADFLLRLKFLVNDNLSVILTDNGSEFQKDFAAACRDNHLTRYYSRVRTPKDNPEVERMIKTLIYEWLNDGNCYEDLYEFNKSITEFLVIYNSIRPHQSLNYLTPLAYAEQKGILSKRWSSSTARALFRAFCVIIYA